MILALLLAAAQPATICSTRDYLALRCGGEGDAYEKDVLAERGKTLEDVDRLVRAYRLAKVRREGVYPANLPDPAKDYADYVEATGGAFRCDDEPYLRGCGNDDTPHREREEFRICGPKLASDDDGVNFTCKQEGWDNRHHHYLEFCGTRWTRHILADPQHRPLPNDPWVRWYVAHGFADGVTLDDAQIARADNVVNGCDE